MEPNESYLVLEHFGQTPVVRSLVMPRNIARALGQDEVIKRVVEHGNASTQVKRIPH